MFLTAAFTGLRMGELLALRWRDVDFAARTIRVRASYYLGQLTTPKSGKVRSVPLAPDAASALAQLGQREDWVGDDDRCSSASPAATSMVQLCVAAIKRLWQRRVCGRCASMICGTRLAHG